MTDQIKNKIDMKVSVAVIPPVGRADVLADTVLDGLIQLSKENSGVSFALPKEPVYETPLLLEAFKMAEVDFLEYCRKADVILLLWGKQETNMKLALKAGVWKKTFYVDGSELGGDRRYDQNIQKRVLNGTYDSHGKIDKKMLEACAQYFRREKPYTHSIIPLPFGIESRYVEHYSPDIKKDIDFFCVFGQDEFPLMRRYAKEVVKNFCEQNGFTYQIETTKGFTFDPAKKNGREDFYHKLARSKVGISIGGGGFDTSRFWEVLGNNCLLLTERIDIYEPDSTKLNYKRILQFNNLYDLQFQLEKVGKILKNNYNQDDLSQEYEEIMKTHSSKARVLEILAKV